VFSIFCGEIINVALFKIFMVIIVLISFYVSPFFDSQRLDYSRSSLWV